MYDKDYYQILGVMPTAEDIVIRAAYKALAQRYHPDKYKGDPAEAKRIMQGIVEAYAILSDTDKRKQYDVWLSQQSSGSEYQPDDQDDDLNEAIASYGNDWKTACSIYPDLQEHYVWLNKVAHRLGATYKIFLLETKAFKDRKVIAQLMENDFFKLYFGENAEILAFAKSLVRDGKKAAARTLNNYIRVVGQAVDSHHIIEAVCVEYGIPNLKKMRDEAWEKARQETIGKWQEERESQPTQNENSTSIEEDLGISASATNTSSNKAKDNNASADRHTRSTAQAPRNELTDMYEASIGEKNTSYYLTKFAQFDGQGPGLKASWNWAAFFLVPIWALYRKMYGLFFALWGASFVATFIAGLNAPLILDLAVLAAWAAFGIYANSIYHHHIKKKIAVVQSTVRAPNVLTSLGNKGGVNAWVSWVGIGLIILSFLSAIVLPPTESTTTASTPNRVSAQNTSESVEPPVVSAVSHQDAVSSIASGWVLVERFSDADVYADSSSISRTGDLVDMWALVDYKTAIVDEQSDPYKSFMALSSYDCRTSQIKVRGFRAYAQNMGRGRQVMAYFDPSSGWSVVTSSEMSRWKYACGKQ